MWCIHRVYMWEVEPTLYWRVKVNGKWSWRRAKPVSKFYSADGKRLYWSTPHLEREVSESE